MTSVNGSRSAAITGGSTALIDRDHRGDEEGAARVVDADPADEPGGDVDRAAETTQATISRSGRSRRPRRLPGDLGSVAGSLIDGTVSAAGRLRITAIRVIVRSERAV